MNSFLIGLQFLTRIFVVKQTVWTEKSFGESVRYFPLIGAVLGIISAAIVGALNIFTGGSLPLFTGVIAFVSLIILTGGMHCDGLMDSVDGLFSGREGEKILQIMKDSRAGSFGVVAMILVAALEISSLAELARLSTWQLIAAIYSAPIIGRMMMVTTIGLFPYARPEGMGKAFAEYTTRRTIFFAVIETILLLLPLIILGGQFLICAGLATLTALLITWRFAMLAKEKIGGVTGDIYGAVTTLSEVTAVITFLLTAVAMK
ncbi:MAG: adenosylcobinamide-GDP ribazoletransferase [Selenomonadaceae bacterium]|nr:adenosylcobinamide-GDP ribazoletransferase [Selenomonadaceae bacterium]